MKVIITGATGFVGTHLIQQAIRHPSITSVVALARRATPPPTETSSSNAAKFKAVVCEDFSVYSESVKEELAGADACIWLLAVTPSKIKSMALEDLRKICYDYTVTGLEALSSREGGSRKPLRFVYVSGAKAERDQSKKSWILGDYTILRGECETKVLEFAEQSNGAVESYVLKPGLINSPGRDGIFTQAAKTVGRTLIGLPIVEVDDVAATLLDVAVNGYEKDTILNGEITSIGQRVQSKEIE